MTQEMGSLWAWRRRRAGDLAWLIGWLTRARCENCGAPRWSWYGRAYKPTNWLCEACTWEDLSDG